LRIDGDEMVDEVETDLEPPRVIDRDAARRETPEVWTKSYVPPVVPRGHVGELDLPDDLEPKMKCVLRRSPAVQREVGQNRIDNRWLLP
jgi:hypothetical protein